MVEAQRLKRVEEDQLRQMQIAARKKKEEDEERQKILEAKEVAPYIFIDQLG